MGTDLKHSERTEAAFEVPLEAAPARMYLAPATEIDPAKLVELIPEGYTDPAPPPSFLRRHGLIIGLLVLPVLLGMIYFGWIAAGLYVSEAKFIVRTSGGGSDISLTSLMQNPGLSRAVDETYAVGTYMTSRDMVDRLSKERELRTLMSRPEGDFIYRFPNFYTDETQEQLFRAFQRFIDIDIDTSTGITTLRTKAFRAEDALILSKNVIEFADEFINRLNIRAHGDAIRYSEALVSEINQRLLSVEGRLARYRNREMILNPEKESVASLEMLAKLSTIIAREEATLAQQIAQTPNSPAIASQREKVSSLRVEFEKLKQSIAGGQNSIASKLEEFERLTLERELVAKGLAVAIAELEKARQTAQTQRIYLQTIVAPHLPDFPTRPLRLLSILIVIGISAMIYSIVRSLTNIVLEHQA